jgi:hypothetical protein
MEKLSKDGEILFLRVLLEMVMNKKLIHKTVLKANKLLKDEKKLKKFLKAKRKKYGIKVTR